MLKKASVQTKSLLNRLSRIVIAEETLHKVLDEGHSKELEVLAEDQLNMKIRLRDKIPPLTIFVKNFDERNKDLIFYSSTEVREPCEGEYDNIYGNVSRIQVADCVCSLKRLCTMASSAANTASTPSGST